MSALQALALAGIVPSCADAPVVVLGGWGVGASALAELGGALGAGAVLELPELPAGTLPAQRAFVHGWIEARLPPRAVLIGWSLGGALAIDFAAAHPKRLAALVTIATNPRFCSSADWPLGMEQQAFDAFRTALRANAARQLQRFAALQAQGDAEEHAVLRRLRAAIARDASTDVLLAGLDMLGGLDLRAPLQRLALPTLHVLGTADRLVPRAVAHEYLRLQPTATVWTASDCAHAPFLSRAAAVAARIRDFLDARRMSAAPRRDKGEIARSFARAAPGYDSDARVQRASGCALRDLVPADITLVRGLDLGCGTGAELPALAERFPRACWTGADIAEGMLRAAASGAPRASLCGADAERLPFAAQAFDLVFSNLALQWCDAPGMALAEIARVLRPGGAALLATLGPDTLWELRAAWRAIDRGAHVHRFEEPAAIVALAQAAGLHLEHDARLWHVERHPTAVDVARALRRLGAHNQDPARRRGLTGKRAWARLEAAYAGLGDGRGDVPATWQIVHLVMRKNHE